MINVNDIMVITLHFIEIVDDIFFKELTNKTTNVTEQLQ